MASEFTDELTRPRRLAASRFLPLLLLIPFSLLANDPALAQSADDESNDKPAAEEAQDAEERPTFREEVEIRERVDDLTGIAATSSEGVSGRLSLQARPIQRAGELVETVPGMIATQHSGDGKANQYFVRGFNLDHGTDFRLTVAGMPVNMPSHGHGQGYADLNFVIPEMVSRMRFAKGTALAEGGDFSAAGRADIELMDVLPEGFVELSLGEYDYRRAVFGESFSVGRGTLTTALEVHGNDGPWLRGNDFERVNGYVRYSQGDGVRGWSLTAMAYDASWLSTDQVPQRAIDSGAIDRFGLIDPGPRGDSSRYSLSSDWRWGDDSSTTHLNLYTMTYDLNLISNFTYFLEDPERGDQFQQVDDRSITGGSLRHHRMTELGGRSAEWSLGFEVRFDDIDNGLFRTQNLTRFGTVRSDSIEQLGLGAFGELSVDLSDKVRATLGLRVDSFDADVDSVLAANTGSADDVQVSPKLALAFGPWNKTEVFVNAGYGFHSNDARGATIRIDPVNGEAVTPVDPLVRAFGTE
ncbi:MAG: TonB-dependent receptor, partial [Acidobacteriota bacterium]